jgi:hypothetical protein
MLPFNEIKATQAAARFLSLAGGQLNYMVLLKLLYMLDRSSFLSWGRPVTFDEYYSMRLGPVLSEVHDLITEMPMEGGYWPSHITIPANNSVELKKDPGADALSESEDELIQQIFKVYGHYNEDPFALVDLLHKILPEWTEVKSGRVPLPYQDILLKAGKKSPDQIKAIESELDALAEDYRILSAHS